MAKRPGGVLATRPLHFFWICDCSGSMKVDGKIQSLNYAIQNALPDMQRVAAENPFAEMLVRTLRFSSGAQWVNPQAVKVAEFKWQELPAAGVTDMGKALTMVAEQLKLLPDRGFPPVLVLISDGQPTDNIEAGLKELLSQPWGQKAVRVAIAIGEDADIETLQQFIGNPQQKPLQASNPEALVRHIRFISTAVVQSASSPASSDPQAEKPGSVPLPPPPDKDDPVFNIEVW
jgi:uncharacterized protein YegL